MAEGIEYNVIANLKLEGDEKAKHGLDAAAGKADALSKAFDNIKGGAAGLGGGLADLGMSAVSIAAKIGRVGIEMGLAIGGHLATGITHVLSETEDSANSLGAVIGAATGVGFKEGKEASTDMFNNFREMAIESAAETKNFVDIAKGISGPLLGAGKSLEFVQNMTRDVINTASAAGIGFEQMGNDVTRMAQGMAGAHEPTWRFLQATKLIKMTSQEFNALAPDKRIDMMAKALSNPAIREAAAAFGASFTGLKSTLTDEIKLIGATVGGPAFTLLKKRMSGLADGLKDGLHDPQTMHLLALFGSNFATRIDSITVQLGRMFPSLIGNADDFGNRLVNAADYGMAKIQAGVTWIADKWPAITDGAHRFAAAIEHGAEMVKTMLATLGGGDALKGLERAAKMLAMGKAGGAIAPMVGGAMQMGQGVWGLGSALLGGGGAAAAAAPAAAGAAGAAEAGAVAAGAAGATAGPLILAAAVALGELVAVIQTDALGAFKLATSLFGDGVESWSKLGTQVVKFWNAASPIIGTIASYTPIMLAVQAAAVLLGAAFDGIGKGLTWMFDQFTWAANELTKLKPDIDQFFQDITDNLKDLLTLKKSMLMGLKLHGVEGRGEHETPKEKDYGGVLPFITGPSTNKAGKDKEKAPPPQGVTVTIKWDLGDGDAEDVFIRTRKSLLDSMKAAKMHATTTRMPGLG